MFDPFGDFEASGYLRNKQKERDLLTVKRIEHELFVRKLPEAIKYLDNLQGLYLYNDFLKVHEILFSEFYPWAGKDRLEVTPDKSISKAGTHFANPNDIQLAIDAGLRLAQSGDGIEEKPGEVMGLFAYGHPFLDGNGRASLIIHATLCNKAGFSISWNKTNKKDYLVALTEEITTPGKGILDSYLLKYKDKALNVNQLSNCLLDVKGLDGMDGNDIVDGDVNDPDVKRKYIEFTDNRGYSLTINSGPNDYSLK